MNKNNLITNINNNNNNPGFNKKNSIKENLDLNKNSGKKLNSQSEKNSFKKLEEKNKISDTEYNFPNQFFSLGYILIVFVCKNIKLKIFEYLENFTIENFEEVKKFKLKECCFLHFLVSLEKGLKIDKKFSIKNFFSIYSEDFTNFICNITTISLSNREKTKKKCLQGKPVYNLNSKDLYEHPWIKSERINSYNNLKISMKEVLKIIRESFKTSVVEFNNKKYENILNKLLSILNIHKKNLNEENIKEILFEKKKIIKKISLDIGVNHQEFSDKIFSMVNDIFLSKPTEN